MNQTLWLCMRKRIVPPKDVCRMFCMRHTALCVFFLLFSLSCLLLRLQCAPMHCRRVRNRAWCLYTSACTRRRGQQHSLPCPDSLSSSRHLLFVFSVLQQKSVLLRTANKLAGPSRYRAGARPSSSVRGATVLVGARSLMRRRSNAQVSLFLSS